MWKSSIISVFESIIRSIIFWIYSDSGWTPPVRRQLCPLHLKNYSRFFFYLPIVSIFVTLSWLSLFLVPYLHTGGWLEFNDTSQASKLWMHRISELIPRKKVVCRLATNPPVSKRQVLNINNYSLDYWRVYFI